MRTLMAENFVGKGAILRGVQDPESADGKQRPYVLLTDINQIDTRVYGQVCHAMMLSTRCSNDFAIPYMSERNHQPTVGFTRPFSVREISIKEIMYYTDYLKKTVAYFSQYSTDLAIKIYTAYVAGDFDALEELRDKVHAVRIKFMRYWKLEYIQYVGDIQNNVRMTKRVMQDGSEFLIPSEQTGMEPFKFVNTGNYNVPEDDEVEETDVEEGMDESEDFMNPPEEMKPKGRVVVLSTNTLNTTNPAAEKQNTKAKETTESGEKEENENKKREDMLVINFPRKARLKDLTDSDLLMLYKFYSQPTKWLTRNCGVQAGQISKRKSYLKSEVRSRFPEDFVLK